jgi:hypothetical protein
MLREDHAPASAIRTPRNLGHGADDGSGRNTVISTSHDACGATTSFAEGLVVAALDAVRATQRKPFTPL